MKTDNIITQETRQWLESTVIAYNFCPFAKRELINNRIRFTVSHTEKLENFLENLILECEHLSSHNDIETTLLISPGAFTEFDDYLIMLELAQALLIEQGYEGFYQLASFHPNYRFEGSDDNDPANYTNRSPYPMLHILREASLETALEHYKQPELIPENNIKTAKEIGLEQLQSILKSCYLEEENLPD